MWEDGYTESLTLLPETLAELGATTGLKNICLEEKSQNEWDLSSVVYTMDVTVSLLDLLEYSGFFHFLNSLSEIAREMKSVLAIAHVWKAVEVPSKIEQALRPIHSAVSLLAPKKVYMTLLCTKNFLEEIGDYDWGGEDCLEHLATLHEHLEELRPGNCLSCLKSLHRLLLVQCQHLGWLARHPLVVKKLGRLNLFNQLVMIKADLEIALRYGGYLKKMQEVGEQLDHVQAIDLHE